MMDFTAKKYADRIPRRRSTASSLYQNHAYHLHVCTDQNFWISIRNFYAIRCLLISLPMLKSNLSLGVPGDGRCLFRSVVHGACLRAGKPSPTENRERELADELRATVADEFIKRRADSEWFVEGDFDTYVAQMRQPHVWGGEPELLMSSHVLRVPITVHMLDKRTNSVKIIAEYGQEYGKENPIHVLYHGYGHYDALRSSLDGSQLKQNKSR